MKDQAIELARRANDPAAALNILREYLQAHVLRSLHECEAFSTLAFVGDTALRFLHNLPRFSEDLDFSLLPNASPNAAVDGRGWLAKVKRDLEFSGFNTEVTWNAKHTVHNSWIRIAGLLQDAGLSAHPSQKLAIKLEIDTRPPDGAVCERTIITRHLTFLVQHYDLASLFSGKLHALICRPYPKGRDWFDLIWYRSQVPPVEPNLPLLKNAIEQVGLSKKIATRWKTAVRKRLESFDIKTLANDVRPFLEHQTGTAIFDKKAILSMLEF